jgi:2-polyprenyl-6-methoxyphenol hydroxylase-like FAD-dependent oxidoreductase
MLSFYKTDPRVIFIVAVPSSDVLIVGAGPTGLMLALGLIRHGVGFRLIDEKPGPGENSRAMVVHARTLEFYRQFGFADKVIGLGVKSGAAHVRVNGRPIISVNFKDMGGGISPFPFALAFAQDDHERFLVEQLKAAGTQIEWNTKLTGLKQQNGAVSARLLLGEKRTEEMEVPYVCGCDGAHSQVRNSLGLGFSGGTYEQLFFVADVKIASGFQEDLTVNLAKRVLTLLFPVRSSGMQRLIGLVPPEFSDREDLQFDDIRNQIEPQLDIKVTEVNWFSRYRVHHRVADQFRQGNAFLLGDAGHIHSPAGGQGMNTGIGDAINLGWKLAHVLQKRADPALLDTYEPERIAFARTLVSSTDRAFTAMTGEDLRGEFTRQLVAPLVFFLGTRVIPHVLFRRISQVEIRYPNSSLSEGKAGKVSGGDRLPWTGSDMDNFAPLRSLDWQVHVYGRPANDLASTCAPLRLAIQSFPWNPSAQHAGFKCNATYLVRPDGYVALATESEQASEKIRAFVKKHGLRSSA